ncbi:uncharacterized protein NPIL_150181 [Nephila pilipes]|uniref:Microtubule-associated protein Jupiter n=1 Tax=Nephila pilipes TaxID=299642 RepID=A0A8X6U092_NEPPI|nr:uncharacterized protein NPIL_150181 [Nephila pilipes]
MYNKKFIIGLEGTVPSTRVLKPPGGDCSDLFGLQSRQKTLIQSIKQPTININCLLHQESIQKDDSHHGHSLSRSDSMSTIKSSPDESQSVKSLELLSLKDTPSLSNISIESVQASEKLLKSQNSKEIIIEKGKSDINLEETKCYETKIENNKASRQQESMIKQKDCQTSQNVSKEANPDKNPEDKIKQDSQRKGIPRKLPAPDNITTQKTLPKQNNNISSILGESRKDAVPEKRFLRNPITGALTEVSTWNKSSPALLSMSSMKEKTEIKTCKSKKNSSKIFAFEPVETSNKAYIPRNPITGEGVKGDSNPSNDSRSKIRVTHPPGGISNGIF